MTDSKRIVVALGGNALGKTPAEQLELIKHTATSLVEMIAAGHEVLISHGNGPQVGMIKVATDESARTGSTPEIPFAECGAMSQGYIGYHLVQALRNEMAARQLNRATTAIVTQTVVDADDPAFQKPTKPVGAMLSKEEAESLAAATGNTYVEDAGRGWRWAVASPQPVRVVEADVIRSLLDAGVVTVAAGGGGIPVTDSGSELRGVPAVIDKDRTAALLARDADADELVILTAVDNVYLDYNQPTQRKLETVTASEARKYAQQGYFAEGAMLPKIEACLDFVESGPGRSALITSLEKASQGLEGTCGTHIVAD